MNRDAEIPRHSYGAPWAPFSLFLCVVYFRTFGSGFVAIATFANWARRILLIPTSVAVQKPSHSSSPWFFFCGYLVQQKLFSQSVHSSGIKVIRVCAWCVFLLCFVPEKSEESFCPGAPLLCKILWSIFAVHVAVKLKVVLPFPYPLSPVSFPSLWSWLCKGRWRWEGEWRRRIIWARQRRRLCFKCRLRYWVWDGVTGSKRVWRKRARFAGGFLARLLSPKRLWGKPNR